MYDTPSSPAWPEVTASQVRSQLSTALDRVDTPAKVPTEPSAAAQRAEPPKRGRGHPVHLPATQLWLGLLWAIVEHLQGYRPLTRYLATHPLGCFAPVSITDSALLQRLQQAGLEPLHACLLSWAAGCTKWSVRQPARWPPLPSILWPWMKPNWMPCC